MNWEQIQGIVRHVLTFAGGFAVSGGYIAESELTAAVGAMVTLIGLVWSYVAKRNKEETA